MSGNREDQWMTNAERGRELRETNSGIGGLWQREVRNKSWGSRSRVPARRRKKRELKTQKSGCPPGAKRGQRDDSSAIGFASQGGGSCSLGAGKEEKKSVMKRTLEEWEKKTSCVLFFPGLQARRENLLANKGARNERLGHQGLRRSRGTKKKRRRHYIAGKEPCQEPR